MTVTAIFILGILFGSFINALVWRLHEQRKNQKQLTDAKTPSQDELSILKGRSMCPNCKHTLGAKDLVPVLSWLTLAGRCRYCRKAISWQYPFVEVLCSVLFALVFVLHPISWHGNLAIHLLTYILVVLGLALAVYDAKWYILPNKLVYPFNALAALYAAGAAWYVQDFQTLASAALAALVLYVFFRLIFEASKGQWIGYGDVRLAIGLGLIAGTVPKVLLLLFAASTLGTLVSLPLLMHRKNMHMQIPFGPFLLAATFAVLLWGQIVMDWYMAFTHI